MSNLFVEPLPVRNEEEIVASSPRISASTPDCRRRYTLTSGQTVSFPLFTESPLLKSCQEKPRSFSIDVSNSEFALNNLSMGNDSGITDECSFVTANPRKTSVRSLDNALMNETPPAMLCFDEEEDLPASDDDTAAPTKRGLSDSYRAIKDNSPSMQKSKRSSTEVTLPRVPGCMDASYTDVPLIGDNSREYLLPFQLMCGSEHCDFKCISADTMSDLLAGKYEDKIDSYLIIDTRYPYEYDGGHIKSAVNVTTKEDMSARYLDNPSTTSNRQVVIFHCEFSSKRGPRMCRFVRDQDRLANTHRYPALFYPEMYILHGGYRDFYPLYPELCEPQCYVEMLDPAFEEQLAHWQKTTKQAAGNIGQSTVRALKTKVRSSRQLQLP